MTDRKAWHHPGRESRQARGYGRLWEAIRAVVLMEEPLCRRCQSRGKVAATTNVDHIKCKAKGGSDDRENLQGLCDTCKLEKDAEDKGQRVRHGCTADGFPIGPHHWNKGSKS